MRVDAYMQVNQVYQANKAKRSAKSANGSASDTVEISDFGKDYQIAKQAAASSPDVREDKVEEFKNKLADGTYQVSAQDVADRLASKMLGL